MYFLEQIKVQFIQTLAANDMQAGPDDGFRWWQEAETTSEAKLSEHTQWLSSKDQELLQNINEELEYIDTVQHIPVNAASHSGSFLVDVRDGKVEGYSPEDKEFQQLLAFYTRMYNEIKELRDRWHQIEHLLAKLNHDMWNIVEDALKKGDITSEHLDKIWSSQEENLISDLENQEELQVLETRYDWLKEALKMKISSFVWKEDLTPNMQRVVDEFKQSKFNIILDNYTDEEKLEYFKSGIIEVLEELNREADIALRDEKIVGEEREKLWNERLKSSNEAYEKILENEEIKESLTSKNWETPSFEELQMNHIDILFDKWVDLATLFLVDQNGKSISWEIQEWQKYIINFWNNTHLSWRIDFAFIAKNTQNIKVDGEVLTFEENSYKVDGKMYPMKDGSLIEVGQSFEDKDLPARSERHEKIREVLDGYSVADTHNQVISEAMSSLDPLSAFEGLTLPKWIAWFILMAIIKALTGKEFEKNSETWEWEEVDPNAKPSNADIINGSIGSYYDGWTRIDINSDFEWMSEWVKWLVNIIYQKEARGNPNIIYSWTRIRPPKPITEMTVAEVRKFQDQMVTEQNARWAKHVSSAVWAPQIIRKTMDWAINSWVLNPNEKFDVAAQNRFTLWQLNDVAWMKKFTEGKITDKQFLDWIAWVWASIPTSWWWSKYAWVAWNKSLISSETMLHYINKI